MAEKKDSKQIFQQKLWLGISNLLKEPSSQDPNQPTNFWYSENLNLRTDPFAPTLNPATVKESGGTVTDFVKWMDTTPEALTVYGYGDAGNVYSRTTAGSWANLHTVASSHGNGLQYFYGDDYLYYTSDTYFGRYGPIASSPQFSDNFLKAQGGIPTNTSSLLLASASSMYGHAANSATLEITGNLTLETFFKANTLPTVGNSMTLMGKWDESGATRSYKLDLFGVSGFFGSGSDGSVTISTNTTDAPIDSACTGTSGTQSLTATNASFAAGQIILIHQSQGTNAGQWERNVIQGYTSGTITLQNPLIGTYTTGAQVIVVHQYTNYTINTGITLTPKAWNGTTGGILTFLCNGTFTNNGTIAAQGQDGQNTGTGGVGVTGGVGIGFGGGDGVGANVAGQAEGTVGPKGVGTAANGNGGGGASGISGSAGSGGNATAGTNGSQGTGGNSAGTNDLTTMVFGGGGGGAGSASDAHSAGGAGGGIVFINAVTITLNTGSLINLNGGNSPTATTVAAGGGAGGSCLLKAQTATLGTGLITVSGGTAYNGPTGGDGYIVINYLTSVTGTTSPTINEIQDNTLVTTTTIQVRLGISNDGTAFEYLTQNLNSLTTGVWNRISVAWTASTSTAVFYLNAVNIGSSVGTKTAISSNAALLYLGANKTSVIANYFDGLLNDMRVWSNVQSASQIFANNQLQINVASSGLAAYYYFNGNANDQTSNANNFTLVNSPTYSSDVPFPNPTGRLDIDTQNTNTGSTYTLPTSIIEDSTDQLPFTPTNDPQASIAFYVDTMGTGNWTVTIHDVQNKVIATQTITNANVPASGIIEFIFTIPWRIVIGKTYHAHLTVSTGTSKVVTGTASDFSTAEYTTFFSFLVTDTQFHPLIRWLNFIVVGNERYLGKWDGAFYTPNLIAFPQGTHVRCYGVWGIYLAIGTWQESQTGNPSVSDFATGKIYFWDGISLTYNFSIDVPEGQVNSIFGMDSDLYYFAGYRGDFLNYKGSWANQSGSFNGTKIKRVPYLQMKDYMDIYPQAIANYQGLLYIGMAANTNSTTLPQGVYSWGALYPGYPQSLIFEHIISTGNNSSTVKIGSVYPIQQKLLVSWKDGSAYGVDVIDPTSGIYHTEGFIQTNTIDFDYIYQNDLLLKVRADHLSLNTGEGVQVGYAKNRESTYEVSNSITDTLKEKTTNTASNGRLTEVSFQAMLTGNGSSSPTLLSLAAQVDVLKEEQAF